MFHVVLVEPEIPPNTGNVARLCLATGAHLHLVGPLGFSLDDRQLRRAGLDYWPLVQKTIWPGWADFWEKNQPTTTANDNDAPRAFFLTTKATRPYHAARFGTGDYLVFGRETRGLPEGLLAAQPAERLLTIPMRPAARSLNLATAVAVVLFEAVRQQQDAAVSSAPSS